MTTWFAMTLRIEEAAKEHVLGWLQGLEITGVEEHESSGCLTVYKATPWDRDATRREVTRELASAGFSPVEVTFSETPEEDWLAEWKSHWKPLPLGRKLWIVPAWLEQANVPEDRMALRIDPGMAFGTGTHETTSLAWELLEAELLGHAPQRFLELGMGTGILSLGASLLCPGLQVAGTEGDSRAVPSLAGNLKLNDPERVMPVLTRAVPFRPAWADLAAVNMTYAEHLAVREALLPVLSPRCRLVLSGLFPQQARDLGKWWQERGFTQTAERTLGEWTALALFRARSY